jgi:hypothetical protein
VIVGGLLVGTFFTLFVIPIAYSLISRPRRPVIVPAARRKPGKPPQADVSGTKPAPQPAE